MYGGGFNEGRGRFDVQCHWLLQKRRGDEYANRLELGVLVGRWRTHHARTHDTRLSISLCWEVHLVAMRCVFSIISHLFSCTCHRRLFDHGSATACLILRGKLWFLRWFWHHSKTKSPLSKNSLDKRTNTHKTRANCRPALCGTSAELIDQLTVRSNLSVSASEPPCVCVSYAQIWLAIGLRWSYEYRSKYQIEQRTTRSSEMQIPFYATEERRQQPIRNKRIKHHTHTQPICVSIKTYFLLAL